MDIKKLEAKIKVLDTKMTDEKKSGKDPLVLRSAKKRLKRAQRKKNCMVKRAAFIASKGKKKEETAS